MSLNDGYSLLEDNISNYSIDNVKTRTVDVSCYSICSAGVGRTGTFITLDAMMERLKERKDIDIFEFVNRMRTRRTKMVQSLVS